MSHTIPCGRGNPTLPDLPPPNTYKKKRIIREKTAGTYTSKLRRKIAREIVWKNELDNLFWGDPHQHWGEVFYLEWKNRGPILHLDFNSMYPFQLTNLPFHHPKNLRCQVGDWTKPILDSRINHGLFLCTLQQKKGNPDRTWFSHHHYLRYHESHLSHHFLWSKNARVQTLLHAQDISTLSTHIHITTHWGVFDPELAEIDHPLKTTILDLLEKKNQTPCPKEKARTKLLLVQACSDQPQIHRILDKNKQNAEFTLGQKNLQHPQWWRGPRNSTAHSLFSPIKAAARTELFKLAYFLHKKKATLLRCHTDGLSIGCLSESHSREILHELSPRLGPHPGQLKTTRADEGFFLGPAIWWSNTKNPNGTRTIAEYAGANPNNPFLTETVYQKNGELLINNALFLEETSKTLRREEQGLRIWKRTNPQNPKTAREKRKQSRNTRLKYYLQYKETILQTPST